MTPLKAVTNPSYSGMKDQMRMLTERVNMITGTGQVVSDDSTTESTLLFSEESWVLSLSTIANAELQQQIDDLADRVTVNEGAIADLEDAQQEAEDIAAGNILGYSFSHIGDVKEGVDTFTWDTYNGISTKMSTTGNGFTDISDSYTYSYAAVVDIINGPTYLPASGAVDVEYRAQKLDGTWVTGAGGGNWGLTFMQATAVGSFVPIQARFVNSFLDVVTDTAWFDIGGYTFLGVVESQNILQYNGSGGSASHDDRDGV